MRDAKQPAALKGKGVSMLSTLDARKQLMLEAAKRAKEETQDRFESWRRELIEAVAENEEDQWLKDMLEDKDTLADYAEDFHSFESFYKDSLENVESVEEFAAVHKAFIDSGMTEYLWHHASHGYEEFVTFYVRALAKNYGHLAMESA